MKEKANNKKKQFTKNILYILSVIFYLGVWQAAATCLNKEIFLPKPIQVFEVLFKELIFQKEFWISIYNSITHIGLGFVSGAIVGIILAIFSYKFEIIKIFLAFPIKIIKSVPVASFVILVLLWISSSELSIVIPFLMVMPILYINTLTGLTKTDNKLLEMSKVFRVSMLKKAIHIYIPQAVPYIISASSLAVGMAWKSGIAAEIIGLARFSIGNQLYQTKIYLMTPELFAWTIVITTLSILFEWIINRAASLVVTKKMWR